MSTQIWMFHRVIPDHPVAFGLPGCSRIRGTAMTAAEFEQSLDRSGRIVPLPVLEDALQRGLDPPAGTVLTFDDGYREHLDLVAPMLWDRGVTATFYVATGLHGGGLQTSVVDTWYWLLDHAIEPDVRFVLNGHRVVARLDDLDTKRRFVRGPEKQLLLAASADQQWAAIEALAHASETELPQDLARRLYMTPTDWDDLRELGMTVGAHSVSHPRLADIPRTVAAQEIAHSLENIGAGVPFAYPDGSWDEEVLDLCRRSGASSAVTCDPGAVVRDSDLMCLPRVFIQPHTLAPA